MASVIATGLFNAVAFAGAGFLFCKMNKHGYEDEMKKHNEAMEKLTKAKEEWYEHEVQKKNRMEKLRQEAFDASKDMEETSKALHEYRTIKEEIDESHEPTINDFYKPSKEMKSYISMTKGIIGLGVGYIVSKAIL